MTDALVQQRSRRRLVGVVGQIIEGDVASRRFVLEIDDGMRLPCRLIDDCAIDTFSGARVMVTGWAVWSIQGELLRIEVDYVTDGSDRTPAWSRPPMMPGEVSPLPPDAPSPRSRGYDAIIGAIPDDDEAPDEPVNRGRTTG